MAKMQEKSNFSITCSLLSQYIKEKGSLADLGFLDSARLGKHEAYRPLATRSLLSGVGVSIDDPKDTKSMELFPQIIGFLPAKEEAKEHQENSQLTIFYGGKVFVFENFPDEKAKDLMEFARKGQNFTSEPSVNIASGAATPVVDAQSSPATDTPMASFQGRAKPNFTAFVFLLLLLEAAITTDIFLNRNWEADFPRDPTGRLDELKDFVQSNFELCKLISILVVVAQALSIFLAMVLRSLGSDHDYYYDSDDDSVPARLPLLRNDAPNTHHIANATLFFKNHPWIVRIHDKIRSRN